MKKLFYSAVVLMICSGVAAQHQLEKIWETDSVTLKGPESALFDPISHSLYVSSMGSGTVVRYGTDGQLIRKDWVTGLNANKGSALYKGSFYTAETASVAVVDVEKATLIKRIPVNSAQMLNDLAIDDKGIIYVSDTRTGKVYRIEGDKPEVYLENMPGANGLLTVNSDLYVVTSSAFLKVDANKVVTTIADGFVSGLDGIVMVGEKEFILSNYQGILYYVHADGTKETLLDTRASRIMSNDISYDSNNRIIYAPAYSTNRIIAYRLK